MNNRHNAFVYFYIKTNLKFGWFNNERFIDLNLKKMYIYNRFSMATNLYFQAEYLEEV